MTLPRPDPIRALPIVILMIKSNCNCRCEMCDIWRDRTGAELPLPRVEALLEELPTLGAEEIVLSGGEPLMHSAVEKICAAVRSRGLRLTLLTTGLLLQKHVNWIGRLVNRIYVSLDGPEDTHDAIRHIPGAYTMLAAGVAAVRRNNPDLPIGARCTIQRKNFARMNETVASARQLGLDTISFLAADVQPGNFGRGESWIRNGIALSPDELPVLRVVLDRLYETGAVEFASGFIVEPPEKLERRIYEYFRAHAGMGEFPEVRCNAPWVSTVIETDGRVRPCFFHRPYQGNLAEQPLEQIINSAGAGHWRHGLDMTVDPICRRCVCSLARA